MAYSWPGNVRELEHFIERTFLLTPGEIIREVNLPESGRRIGSPPEQDDGKTLADAERNHIIRILNQCGGKVYGPGGAAGVLGLPASTLNSRIRKTGYQKE